MLKYLRYIVLVGPKLLYDWFFFLRRYAKHPEKYPLKKRYARVRGLIRYVLARMRLEITEKGYGEYLKRKGPRLYVSNHISDLDPLLLIALSPGPLSFVAKKEALKMPVIGVALKAIDGFFMDRGDLMQSAKVLRAVGERLKEGDISYCIFPEGTRNKDPEGELLPFHPGSYKAAVWSGVRIEEIAICGTTRILHTKPNDKRQPIFVSYLGTVEPGKNTVEEAEKSRERIAGEVAVLREEDRHYYEEGRQKKSLGRLPRPYMHS